VPPTSRSRVIVALALGIFTAAIAKADSVVPISSQLALSANTGITLLGPTISMQPTQSQGGTLNTLNVSVSNSLVYPASAPLLVGAACNSSAPNYCVSVGGQATANWTNAANGTVTFTNYGWYDNLATSGVGTPTAGTSTLVPIKTPQQFAYSFISGIAGTMNIDYTISYTSPNGTGCFGGQTFDVVASGGQGGPAANVGLSNACGTVSGVVSSAISPDAPYNLFIQNQSNLSGGLGNSNVLINATFGFSIPNSPTPIPTPEPSSLLLLCTGITGLIGLGLLKGRLV
jgi:hypothetical protein